MLEEAKQKINLFQYPHPLDPDLHQDDAMKKFQSAMQNDLDTPQALSVIEQTIQQNDYMSAKKMLQTLGLPSE
jgi:cysteinyl-tRNA synthetase